MAQNGTNDGKFKINDRVKRTDQPSIKGLVTALREDVTVSKADLKEAGTIVGVQWDSGTFSYFSPDALEVVAK